MSDARFFAGSVQGAGQIFALMPPKSSLVVRAIAKYSSFRNPFGANIFYGTFLSHCGFKLYSVTQFLSSSLNVLVHMPLDSMQLDAIASSSTQRSKRARADEGISTPSGTDLSQQVRALAELELAAARLSLQNDLSIRNHAAALEFVVLLKRDHPFIKNIRSARVKFEEECGGKKGHGRGTPDMWCFKALCLTMKSLLTEPTEVAVVDSILSQVSSPLAYAEYVCALHDKDLSDDHEYKGYARMVIEFGPASGPLHHVLTKYIMTLPGAEIRPGRAARGPLARATQKHLDAVSKLMKKN